MRINELRGLLSEFGEVMGKRRAAFEAGVPKALERLSSRLSPLVIEGLREQFAEVSRWDEQIKGMESRLRAWYKQTPACQVLGEIPGVGLLTAAVAMLGDGKAFRSGRQFAAYVGLVPRHTGTGGKLRMLGISKRGDRYLRTLLIHGARSVQAHTKSPGEWLQRLSQRRPRNVVTVALANKMARTIWALLVHGRRYGWAYANAQPASAG